MMNPNFLSSPFFKINFLGDALINWFYAIIIFVVIIFLLRIFRGIILLRLKKLASKTETGIDDMAIGAVQSIHWPFYVLVALYFSLKFVSINNIVEKWSYYIILVVGIFYAIKFLASFIDFGAEKIIKDKKEDAGVVRMVGALLKISLWVFAIILLLSNLGYNVTSLIAGLGIGGVAVALALQNILGDLFSAVAIYLDKPFQIGDFIVVGEYMGNVKKIGIKTTRIQTLQGEELVVSNNELTQSKIQNFGVMKRRRVVFSFGVTYDTAYDKLKSIPEMIKKIISSHKETSPDRVHFRSFGDSSLDFEVVYFIESGDYNVYMDIQEAINLEIVKIFTDNGIEMAFPTRTVYMKK